MSYEEDQEQLRRQLDGEVDEDLNLVLPEPEVNPEVYKDIEPVLFRGFLHVPAEINGVRFVFKSLNHHEFLLLGLMQPDPSNHKAMQQYHDHFLAFGVLMVDGINILPERDQWLNEIAETFSKLADGSRKKIVRYLSEINRRAARAIILAEAYAMEPISRLRWAQLGNTDLTSPSITGFAGTQNLGLNWAQLTWRALNHAEDVREQAEREWENAKFVASSMAGKGMSRIYSQDKRRRQNEQNERRQRKDRLLRYVLLGESLDEGKGSANVQVARTTTELYDQLVKGLAGEKDWHDQVVEEYENRVRMAHQQRLDQIRDLQKTWDDKWGSDRSSTSVTDFRGLTPEAVQARITERQQQLAAQLSAQPQYPELQDPKVAQFVEKWTSASAGGSEGAAPVVVEDRPRVLPFKRGS